MHYLALNCPTDMTMQQKVVWLAEQGRKRLPDESYAAEIYDFVKAEYDSNPDKDNWERTRDALYERYQKESNDGYRFRSWFDADINYGASIISLLYGEGDFNRTIRIGSLCGWDSDNPTATCWALCTGESG